MLQYLNPKNLSLLRSYLPEILFVLLTSVVVKLYVELSNFQKEVREQVLIKLVESTEAINKSTEALQKITVVIEKQQALQNGM